MKGFALILGVILGSCLYANGQKLIDCDFNGMKKHHFNRMCSHIAYGTYSLFTEANGNLCGQWKVDKIRKDKAGNDYVDCDVFIGSTAKNKMVTGFKPGRAYAFSVKLKGGSKGLPVSIKYLYWVGENFWKDLRTTKSLIKTSTEDKWVEHHGEFVVPANAKGIALQLQMWGNSKYGPLKYKSGDYILFDDIKVWERQPAQSGK